MTTTSPFDPDSGSTEAAFSPVAFSPVAFANATTTFVLFGTTASLYGPLLISFSHRFHLSLPTAGAVLSVHFVGALCGVPLGWWAVKRLHGRTVLAGALVLMAAGAAGAAACAAGGHWIAFLASVFVIGLGFGGVDFGLNSLIVRTAPEGRAHRLSIANAGYGVGAVVGPVLIVAIHPHNFPALFAAIALTALVLSTLNRGVSAAPLTVDPRHAQLVGQRAQRRPILVTFIVAYVLYVAAESSTAGWIAPHLHRVGYSQSVASYATAGFWLGLAIGRVLVGPLRQRFSDKRLVLGGLAVTTVLAFGALVNALAPYLYPAMGLLIASVYPMGLLWYIELSPHDGDGLALLILFMMSGGVIGPATVSFMVSVAGIHAVPVVIAVFTLADLAVFASARRFTARAST